MEWERRGVIGLVLGIAAAVVLVIGFFPTCTLSESSEDINRGSFPKGFVFGTASSAFQVSSFIFHDYFILSLFFKIKTTT